jgi:hypothetical protein
VILFHFLNTSRVGGYRLPRGRDRMVVRVEAVMRRVRTDMTLNLVGREHPRCVGIISDVWKLRADLR